MSNCIDILEDLIDDDPFIRAYKSFGRYIDEWDNKGGVGAWAAPDSVIFEFYAEKLFVDDALALWFTYSE